MGADPAARRTRYRYKAVAWSTQWHPPACALVAAGAWFSATGRKLGVEGPSWASRQSAARTSAYTRIEANGEHRGDSFQADGEAPMGFPSDIHSHSAISWRWYRYRHTHVVAVPEHLGHTDVYIEAQVQRQDIRCPRRVCVCVCVRSAKSTWSRQSLAQHEVLNWYKLAAIPAAKCWHQTARCWQIH